MRDRVGRMMLIAMLPGLLAGTANAFDLQGHRGARGLAPENTLAGFEQALRIGVTTLELDLAMTKDDVLVVSHDRRLNPEHTRAPGGAFLDRQGPPIRSLTLAEVQQYDVGRLKPGTGYARLFPEQRAVDGARIPTLTEVFDLARRTGAAHVRFNIETKLAPAAGREAPDPETFAAAVVDAVRASGLTARVSVQSFDWRTLLIVRRIAPEIERVCLTINRDDSAQRPGDPGASSWTAGLDVRDFGGSMPRMVAAARCATWSPHFRDLAPAAIAAAKALGLKVIPWTVNERADMERLIALGVDGIITDYPDRLRSVMAAKAMPLPPQVQAR